MTKVYIKTKYINKIKSGYLWVFDNQIEFDPSADKGEIVEVFSKNGESFGLAFYNPISKIRLRLLKSAIDCSISDIIRERIRISNQLRLRLFPNEDVYRLAFSESDFLPGLIIDRYGDYFVIQTNSAGMENQIDTIIETLIQLFPECKGIYAKNTTPFRRLEGLHLYEKVIYGTIPDEIIVVDAGIKYRLSILTSQKTGLFLDQRMNHLFIRNLAKGLDVLDCYCNVGGFGLNALKGGANQVTFLDISKTAIEDSQTNCSLNGFQNVEFKKENAKDFLRNSYKQGRKWDLIILDPPSFGKNKSNIQNAIAGYSQINKYALRVLKTNGFLATASCSNIVDEVTFEKILKKVAYTQNIDLRLVFRGTQSPDHPILFAMPETRYLKFFVFQKI